MHRSRLMGLFAVIEFFGIFSCVNCAQMKHSTKTDHIDMVVSANSITCVLLIRLPLYAVSIQNTANENNTANTSHSLSIFHPLVNVKDYTIYHYIIQCITDAIKSLVAFRKTASNFFCDPT